MDKKLNCKIPKCGAVPDLTGVKLVVGVKQLKKAVISGRARYVFLAENADPAMIESVEALCGQYHIQIARMPSMLALGRACGIEVGAAAAAVVE